MAYLFDAIIDEIKSFGAQSIEKICKIDKSELNKLLLVYNKNWPSISIDTLINKFYNCANIEHLLIENLSLISIINIIWLILTNDYLNKIDRTKIDNYIIIFYSNYSINIMMGNLEFIKIHCKQEDIIEYSHLIDLNYIIKNNYNNSELYYKLVIIYQLDI